MASANSMPVRATVRAVRFLNANEPFLVTFSLEFTTVAPQSQARGAKHKKFTFSAPRHSTKTA